MKVDSFFNLIPVVVFSAFLFSFTNLMGFPGGVESIETVSVPVSELKTIKFELVNFSESGYIITVPDSGDRILGFSPVGKISSKTMPPALKELLHIYAAELESAQNIKTKNNANVILSSDDSEKVDPLLYRDGKYNVWGQGAPYNKLTPVKNGENSWVGCGAMATGQIMWFWQHPKKGKGSEDGINFGETQYRWDLMPDVIDENTSVEEIDATATMLYHVGVAIQMRYNYPEESLTHPSNIAPALGDQEEYGEITPGFFRYHAVYYDGFIGTSGVGQTAVVLITELETGRPVQFNALKPAGHAFVCDGYDSMGETEPLNYYFHFNFGWNGDYDGYFLLSAIGPVHETDITFIPNYKIVKEIYPIVENCEDTICSGHGMCVETAGVPECVCDEGYLADNMFRCLADNDDPENPDDNDDPVVLNDDDFTENDENNAESDENSYPDTDSVTNETDNGYLVDESPDLLDDNKENTDNDMIGIDNTDKKSNGCNILVI